MGLLGDIYSYGDGLKRKLTRLLADPAGTIDLGVQRFGEDQNGLMNALQSAYPMPGEKSVMVSPQQNALARALLADYGAQSGMAGMTSKVDYRGSHTAPMKDRGAPLHELNKIYPDDIYSPQAAQYYGHYGGGSRADAQSVALMQGAKDRPNMPVTMYRAVPYEASAQEQLKQLDKQMAQFLKRGTVPTGSALKGSDWYDNASLMRERLAANVESQPERLRINNGDWVTLNKEYAKEHGEGALNGKYKIVSQKVPARKLFTDGNSIHEFGYDESGKVSLNMLGLLAGGAGGLAAYDAFGQKP